MPYNKSLREDGYLNDFHKEKSIQAQKAVKKMKENPASLKEMREQMIRHREGRDKQKINSLK